MIDDVLNRIDPDRIMTRRDVVRCQAEINLKLGIIAEEKDVLHRQILEFEAREHTLLRELAELAVFELALPPPLPVRAKHAG